MVYLHGGSLYSEGEVQGTHKEYCPNYKDCVIVKSTFSFCFSEELRTKVEWGFLVPGALHMRGVPSTTPEQVGPTWIGLWPFS